MQPMTPRQRVLAALNKQPTDKMPFTIYESKIPQCSVERQLRNEGLCIVHRNVSALNQTRPNCVGRSYIYTEDGRKRVRNELQTPAGTLNTVTEPAGFTSWTLEKLFKSPADYKALLAMVNDTRYSPSYEAVTAAQSWMGDDVILRGGVGMQPLQEIMIHWMGVETFAIEWMDNRDEVLKLEKAMAAKLREAFPLMAAAPFTHCNLSGNEVPEMIGPHRYREFCIPLINECAEHFHRHGRFLGSHMDGNNKPWAADLAASGLDYIEAFTPSPDTDLTIEEALAAWPDKVLWINFPSSLHLSSIDTIKKTTRRIIEASAGANRVILGITEDMPPDRWQGNLLAISEVINEMA